ncbi:MAG: M3 family metallopeptidase [Rhodanobacteraceae bacterium]
MNPGDTAHSIDLPDFAVLQPDQVMPAVKQALADYQQGIDDLTGSADGKDFDSVMLAWERLQRQLDMVWAPISHLHSVADNPQLRKAHADAEALISDFAARLGQNRQLFEAVEAVASAEQELTTEQRALVEHALRDFRLSGVALDEPARSRFRQIANQLSRLGTEFANAVLDATESWQEHIVDERDLAGLPDSARDILRAYAEEQDLAGYLVTLRQPSVQAVLTHADDRDLREKVYWAYQTRASDQGPQAGRFDNSERIAEILSLRHEAARLLGFDNAASESLATKMAQSPHEVLEFEQDLAARARPVAERELTELRRFAAEHLGLDNLEAWDIAYASEKLRRQTFDLDEEQLKPYFPLPTVKSGMFALAERLYGIRLVRRDDVSVWHADVEYWDVLDGDGTVIAGLYLDLVARSGKRGGAWMDVCRDRFADDQTRQVPVAFLTCNFAPPGETRPALLGHDDVLTLLHEFGHSLHHMLTEVNLPSIGGINGVEWDAVELPSQFMENFGWNRDALALLSGHWQSGEKLPEELFRRMLAARHYHAGLFLLRQLEFGLFDFHLHLDYQPDNPPAPMAVLEKVRRQVSVLHPPAWQRFPHGFTHIFAGGYAAGYYSYLWAELLSADVFSEFEQHGVIDPATGARFRNEVLAVGASRPAMQSFIAFRGREPRAEALLASYGLAEQAAD